MQAQQAVLRQPSRLRAAVPPPHLRHPLHPVAWQHDADGGGRLAVEHVCGCAADGVDVGLAGADACTRGRLGRGRRREGQQRCRRESKTQEGAGSKRELRAQRVAFLPAVPPRAVDCKSRNARPASQPTQAGEQGTWQARAYNPAHTPSRAQCRHAPLTGQVLICVLQVPALEPPHVGQGSGGGAAQARCSRAAAGRHGREAEGREVGLNHHRWRVRFPSA